MVNSPYKEQLPLWVVKSSELDNSDYGADLWADDGYSGYKLYDVHIVQAETALTALNSIPKFRDLPIWGRPNTQHRDVYRIIKGNLTGMSFTLVQQNYLKHKIEVAPLEFGVCNWVRVD